MTIYIKETEDREMNTVFEVYDENEDLLDYFYVKEEAEKFAETQGEEVEWY